MLNRLGLVIHILGWLIGIAASVIIYTAIQGYCGPDYDACIRWDYLTNYHWVAPISPLIGWAIRFILTSHKSPLPWVANKEAT